MKKAMKTNWLRGLWISCCAALCTVIFYSSMPGVIPAWAADSTSFNPLSVSVQAQAISGVPVGTIISWPVASNPEGWAEGNWLECNGQYISPSAYPELCAVVGGSVPDLRGLFLRGVGGQSAGLGSVQGDAMQRLSGIISKYDSTGPNTATGVFKAIFDSTNRHTSPGGGNDYWGTLEFDSALQARTASENRPVNKAVRYLIRARP